MEAGGTTARGGGGVLAPPWGGGVTARGVLRLANAVDGVDALHGRETVSVEAVRLQTHLERIDDPHL